MISAPRVLCFDSGRSLRLRTLRPRSPPSSTSTRTTRAHAASMEHDARRSPCATTSSPAYAQPDQPHDSVLVPPRALRSYPPAARPELVDTHRVHRYATCPVPSRVRPALLDFPTAYPISRRCVLSPLAFSSPFDSDAQITLTASLPLSIAARKPDNWTTSSSPRGSNYEDTHQTSRSSSPIWPEHAGVRRYANPIACVSSCSIFMSDMSIPVSTYVPAPRPSYHSNQTLNPP